MGLFSKLFGGGGGSPSSAAADPVEYKGFTITAEPINEGGQFRTAGTISKEDNGEVRSAKFIRADNSSSEQSAIDHSVQKAKQIIDEQGESLLDRPNL